jgi:hypothetical protein
VSIQKVVAYMPITEEALADARGYMDRIGQAMAAGKASKGQRYRRIYEDGFHAGADAAFLALVEFLAKGGRIGLPTGEHSLHGVTETGMSVEIHSLLALRPFDWGDV